MIQPPRLHIPAEITTERLVLRVPRMGDGALIVNSVLASLPELKPWLPWASDGYTVNDSEDWCRRTAANFLLGKEAGYVIFHRETARQLGTITCTVDDWRIPKMEIGYWLSTTEVGHGYMTEALRAVTQMAFSTMGARRVQVRADAANIRSRRVAERAGFELEGILKKFHTDSQGRLFDDCMYAQTR